MNVYEDILKWSGDKPLWWRDALRRIISNGNYSQNDVDEIFIAAQDFHGIPQPGVAIPVLTPLGKLHIPFSSTPTASIQIKLIKDVSDINALAPSQEIGFAQHGLTVIYGDNGSGKSGYVRILKNACRSRGIKPTILANVYGPAGSKKPQATLEYFENGVPNTLNWVQGDPNPENLKSISIFDSQAGIHYVEKENEVAFQPFGLDVLDRLGEVCSRIKLFATKAQSNHLKATDLSSFLGDTAVGKLISSLDMNTNKSDVNTLALLSEKEESRLKLLEKDIAQAEADDPAKMAIQIGAVVSGLEVLKQHLLDVQSIISELFHEEILANKKEYAATKSAIAVATQSLLNALPLEGVGTETWIELWKAAKAFSIEYAYKGQEFPNTSHDSRCVLCHQSLDKEAKQRFIAFEQFVTGVLQNKADRIRVELSKRKTKCESLKILNSEIGRIVTDLESRSPKLGLDVRDYCRQAEEVRTKLLQSFEQDEVGTIPFPKRIDHLTLESLIQTLSSKSKDLAQLSNADNLIALKQEHAELNARAQLSIKKDLVNNEIDRLSMLHKYKSLLEETNTQRISVHSKKLTEELVIKQLSEEFLNELKLLGLGKLGLELIEKRGTSGVVFHQLVLKGKQSIQLNELLSEGEYRCISLAAFLSENCITPTISGIVFDDPASSLDHIFRRRIADRIVKESANRQVIVFTHDIVFLMFLTEAAQEQSATIQIQSLDYSDTVKGLPQNSPPWDAMKVNDRIGKIKNDLQKLDKIFRTEPKSRYEAIAREIYKHIRSTWERSVEEVLLNGAITRYGRSIQTQRLKLIVNDVTTEDYNTIDKGMLKCSTYFGGHDQSAEINDPVPEPTEIQKDIANLEDWINEVRKRRSKK